MFSIQFLVERMQYPVQFLAQIDKKAATQTMKQTKEKLKVLTQLNVQADKTSVTKYYTSRLLAYLSGSRNS